MYRVLDSLSASKCVEIMTICWALWKARNDRVWKRLKSRANVVVSSALQYLMQCKYTQSKHFTPVTQPYKEGDGDTLWVKPQGETIKVSVDAAIFSDQSAYGVGLVARDSSGELINAISKLYHGDATPELAEVIAIKEALSWVKEKLWNVVEVESDCLVAIQAIWSMVLMVSPFGMVVQECRRMLREVKTTSLSFIKRSANEAAHYMASKSFSFPYRVLDRSVVPIELMNILMSDLSS